MSWAFSPLLPAAELLSVLYWVGGAGVWDLTTTTNWASTSGGTGGAGPPSSGTAVIFDSNSGTGTVTINGGVCDDLTLTSTVSAVTLAPTTSGLSIYGSAAIAGTNATISGSAAINFVATKSKTITTSGETFDCPVTFDGLGGTWTLLDPMTVGPTRTTTLTRGTLDLNGNNFSTGIFVSNIFANARSVLSSTATTIFITCATTATVWSTGNAPAPFSSDITIDITGNDSATKTVGTGAALGSTFNFRIGGNGTTFILSGRPSNLTITNTNCTINNASIFIRDNLDIQGTLPTLVSGTHTWTFNMPVGGTSTITTNGNTLDFALRIQGSGGTLQLVDNLTVGNTRTVELSSGTLNLNGKSLSTGIFLTDPSNIIEIASTTAATIFLTFPTTATLWDNNNSFNSTISTNIILDATASNSGTKTISNFSSSSQQRPNLRVGGNATTISIQGEYRNLTITNTTCTITDTSNPSMEGNLDIQGSSPILTLGVGFTFVPSIDITSRTIRTSGVTLNRGLSINLSPTDSLVLLDDVNTSDLRNSTLSSGILDLNGKTLTVGRITTFTTTGKNLTFNGGTLRINQASSVAFNNQQPSSFTTTAGIGTGKISMTGAGDKTFIGAGSTFNCTLENAGAGALTITGSNTFLDIDNSVQPTTFTFTAGSSTTVSAFSVSGTSGNLVTINSTVSGLAAKLNKLSGTVSISFCSIKDITALGAATWAAYTTNGNINNTGNSGWAFSAIATVGYIKAYMGAGPGWVYKPMKVWNGSSWTIKPVNYYSGTAWITTSGV